MRINVLALDPARVHGVLSNERIAGRERVSAMGRRVGAVAGVNGGYFAPSGDPVGVLAIDGALLSEPVDGRSALVLGARTAAVGARALQGLGHHQRGQAPDRRGRPDPRPDPRLRRPRRRPAHQPAERGAHLHRRERARPALAELRRAPAARGRGGGGAARRDRGEGARARARGRCRATACCSPAPATPPASCATRRCRAAAPRSELTLTAGGQPASTWRSRRSWSAAARGSLRAGRVAVTAKAGGLRAAAGAGILRHLRGRAPAAHARGRARRTARCCS